MRFDRILLSIVFLTALSCEALAVSYASYVHDTGVPNQKEFVLNDAADSITILRNGANAINMGSTPAGRYTFDMTGFTSWEIQVQRDIAAPTAGNTNWSEITLGTQNIFTKYERASDVIVNSDPASPNFGILYVNSVRNVATAAQTTPAIPARQMGDGIYALTGNLIGVDLGTKTAVADANDTTYAKTAANWEVGTTSPNPTVCGVVNPSNCETDLGTTSGWRMSFDEANNVILGDWSDGNGGIKWIDPNLASGGLVLRRQDGYFDVDSDGAAGPNAPERIGLLTNGEGEEVHGSIVSRVYTTGSVGNNLTVYAMDEDYDLDGDTFNSAINQGNHVWKWDVGNATGVAGDGSDAHDQPPTLVINTSAIPDTTGQVKDNWLSLNVGVQADAFYSPQHNKWYLTENRDVGGDAAGFIVVTPDAVDGNSPTLEWSSMQFTIDNGLDGNNAAAATGTQDIFRSMFGAITMSDDGTKLLLHRRTRTDNPVLGSAAGSDAPGAVVIIPLDENGVPDLTVSAGEITNIQSIVTGSDTSTGLLRGVSFDAAGNVYTTNNTSEKLQVFSPLGNYLTTLTSAGTFEVSLVEEGDADYNEDGAIDAADDVARKKFPGLFGAEPGARNLWVEQFGQPSPGGGSNAVPEPASVALVVLGMLTFAGFRRQRD